MSADTTDAKIRADARRRVRQMRSDLAMFEPMLGLVPEIAATLSERWARIDGLTVADLNLVRREYAKGHHPDLLPEGRQRDLAQRCLAIANAAIDRALNRTNSNQQRVVGS